MHLGFNRDMCLSRKSYLLYLYVIDVFVAGTM